jgi:ABC-2 type transport system ATP-binding protein
MYGSTRGIEDVTFDVHAGEVLGFLELRRSIGYLPGIAATYDSFTALKYLQFMARMRNLKLDSKIKSLAERIDLDLSIHIHDLSKGNRQKVSLVQAFMHDPQVIFLDEPTSGLDPLVQREFEKILDEVRARGASVILSSHVLSEVEHLADRIAIINLGRIVVVDEISVLKSKARRKMDLYFDEPVSLNDFEDLSNVKEIEVGESWMRCVVTGSEYELLKRAVKLRVTEVRTRDSSLEEIFLDLVGAK